MDPPPPRQYQISVYSAPPVQQDSSFYSSTGDLSPPEEPDNSSRYLTGFSETSLPSTPFEFRLPHPDLEQEACFLKIRNDGLCAPSDTKNVASSHACERGHYSQMESSFEDSNVRVQELTLSEFAQSDMALEHLEEDPMKVPTGDQHRIHRHLQFEAGGASNSSATLNQITCSDPAEHGGTFGNSSISDIFKPGIGLHQNSTVPLGFDITTSMKSDPYNSSLQEERLMPGSKGFFYAKNYDQPKAQAFFASSSGGHLPNSMPSYSSSCLSCFNQQNPPYDRRITDPQDDERPKARGTSETKGCKRCNCKKTECLKLYCECFSSGLYCLDSCACGVCYNKLEYEDTVDVAKEKALARNALAFTPKIVNQVADNPASTLAERSNAGASSARHKIGCNCKKSKCLKKYCECYQVDVGCSDGCRCEDCNNPYGKKPGFVLRQRGYKRHDTLESADNTAQPLEDVSHMTPLDKSLAEIMSAPPF